MSSPAATSPRRNLAGRPADTVAALVDAAVGEVAETGYDGLTVRNVARRAGVSPATAYTYFASKEHLLTEVFWRRLSSLEEPSFAKRSSIADRVEETVRGLAMLVADEPELAAGVTTAMLAHDHDVKLLRDQIGNAFAARLAHAIGPDADPALLRAVVTTFVGALLTAGMGNATYAELPKLMAETTALMTRRAR
ncbi:MAG: TetR/AcrR family transcriptional regulator [Frankiaceae bacterium]|nr:TetR/AcrR family transcriptional regulator [Frankiaceae bacterium]MBV9872277.1 TetR/AcrR family transcriptional regulator [Frankiaceae bacterium]